MPLGAQHLEQEKVAATTGAKLTWHGRCLSNSFKSFISFSYFFLQACACDLKYCFLWPQAVCNAENIPSVHFWRMCFRALQLWCRLYLLLLLIQLLLCFEKPLHGVLSSTLTHDTQTELPLPLSWSGFCDRSHLASRFVSLCSPQESSSIEIHRKCRMPKANTKQFAFPQNHRHASRAQQSLLPPAAPGSSFEPNFRDFSGPGSTLLGSKNGHLFSIILPPLRRTQNIHQDDKCKKRINISIIIYQYVSFIYAKTGGKTYKYNPSSRHHHHISLIEKLGRDESIPKRSKTAPKYRKL